MYYPHNKTDPRPILVDYRDDQVTLRIQVKGKTVTYTPLDPFFLFRIIFFLYKHKQPIKNNVETLLQQNPVYTKPIRIKMMNLVPKGFLTKPQLSHTIQTFLSEIHYHNFDESSSKPVF